MAALSLVLEAPAARATAERLAAVDILRLLAVPIRTWAEEGTRSLAEATPVQTGQMQRSWTAEVQDTSATIRNPQPYARFVLEGTQAHRIEGHPFLAFLGGAGEVVVRAVESPGTRSNEELARAIEQVVGRSVGIGEEVMAQVAGEVSRG